LSEGADLARRVLDAVSSDDCERFGDLVSDDIEIETARGVRRGHAEAVAWARNKYDHLQRRFAIDEMRPLDGGSLLAIGRTEYVWKDTGVVGDSTPVAIEMSFRGGKLVRWRFREDLPALK
jgi:ketosteroid isomerase-like protein